MAKKRRTRRRSGPSWTERLGARLGSISWLGIARGLVSLSVLSGMLIGAAYGLPELERYTAGLPEYSSELGIELEDLPEWLRANDHIADDIIERCGLRPEDRRLDSGLAPRIGEALSKVGWVKRLRRVSVGADDVVRITCDYREPVAWVASGAFYYLVDADRVRLPGRYSHGEVSRDSGLLLVIGVTESPPAEGKAWAGADLSAAVQMIGMLRDKPYYDQLTGVIVANYGGRLDRSASHIELATDLGSRIRWGRAPGEEIDEPTAVQKLANLQGIWREHDRIDMGRAWVDVQLDVDKVRVPLANGHETPQHRS